MSIINTKIIENEEEYDQALPNTLEGDELTVLLLIIKDYENEHHPVSPPSSTKS